MPKSQDKTKGAKKRKKSPENSSADTESETPAKMKKKTQKKCTNLEGIEMSKQLAAEVKKLRTGRPRNSSKKHSEPRLLGNGKPMPSLAELEAMYADTDDEDENVLPKQTDTSTSVKNDSPNQVNNSSRCSTPTSKPILNELNLNSPKTLKEFTSKVIDILSKKVMELDDGPPPPVIPQKKPKKSDIPFIVGCKDRPQVPWAPKTKFCVGSEDYGIDENQSSDEDDEKKKRKKRGERVNLSKSIFNAKSDEIAERLKELDTLELTRMGSPDSDNTVEYNCPLASFPSTISSFSPLPSTSRDSETIKKNDILFNESLQTINLQSELLHSDNDSPNSIEILDIPQTIEIDETLTDISIKSKKRHRVDIDEDCCIVVEPEIKRKQHSESSKTESPPRDEIYGSIDLTQTYDNEVYEINDDDIDSILEESKVILEKDRKKRSIDIVTHVDPNVIVIESENKNAQQSTTVSNANSSDVIHYPGGIQCINLETSNNVMSPPTPTLQNTQSNEIDEVVTNFFNQPQNCFSTPSANTIDLSTSSSTDTMLSRISSWMSSIESFLIGSKTSRGLSSQNANIGSDVIFVGNYNQTTYPDNSVVVAMANSPHSPINAHHSISNNVERFSQSPTNVQNRLAQSNAQTPTPSPQEEQSVRNDTSVHTPPRSLGDCPICMDSLANSTVASTMCGHVFCMPCIKAAIRANGKKCPACRKSLKGVGYHQLFI